MSACVWITRPEPQAKKLASFLATQHYKTFIFPTIIIKPLGVSDTPNLEHYQIIIATSSAAITYALPHLLKHHSLSVINQPIWLAVGKTTLTTAKQFGVRNITSPDCGQNSEALLTQPELQSIANKNILIIKGVGGRTLLKNSLLKKHANVRTLDVYERQTPQYPNKVISAAWQNNPPDIITITSCEILQNLYDMTLDDFKTRLLNTPLVVASKRIAMHAKQLGFNQTVAIAEGAQDDALGVVIKQVIG